MATQKGRNWSSGDIVTAANLSSIERGVSAVAEEYTPTTWANGNTVTAAGLNNIEQGIANAGGSSDFSTAQVTLTINSTGSGLGGVLMEGLPYVYRDTVLRTNPGASGIYTVPLYKGVADCFASEFGTAVINNVAVSGNAQENGNEVLITGDCTITVDITVSEGGGDSN